MRRLFGAMGSVVLIALIASVLAFSLIAMFRHRWLYAVEPIVCPAGARLELTNASPVPGELVLEASCIGQDVTDDVTAKLVFIVMGMLFLPSLVLGALLVWVRGYVAKRFLGRASIRYR